MAGPVKLAASGELPICPVCCDLLGRNGGPSTLPCGHNGCRDCFGAVQARGACCPLCRAPFDARAALATNHELKDLIALATAAFMDDTTKEEGWEAFPTASATAEHYAHEVQRAAAPLAALLASYSGGDDDGGGPSAPALPAGVGAGGVRAGDVAGGRHTGGGLQQHHAAPLHAHPGLPQSAPGGPQRDVLRLEPPQWLPDSYASHCGNCMQPFKPLMRLRHHCRLCGRLFCHACSARQLLLPPRFKERDPQRVCDMCAGLLEPLQAFLVGAAAASVQPPVHDALDAVSLRSWLNSPWGGDMAAEVYKASNIIRTFNQTFRLEAERGLPASLLAGAKGLAILSVARVGAGWSCTAGTGVVVSRQRSGAWSAPCAAAAYGLGWGLQLGGDLTDVLLVLRTDEAVRAFAAGATLGLGGAAGLALGPLGRSAEASLRVGGLPAARGGVVGWSVSRGAFAGVGLQGSVMVARAALNRRFYGFPAPARALLVDCSVPQPPAAGLLYAALDALTERWEPAAGPGAAKLAAGAAPAPAAAPAAAAPAPAARRGLPRLSEGGDDEAALDRRVFANFAAEQEGGGGGGCPDVAASAPPAPRSALRGPDLPPRRPCRRAARPRGAARRGRRSRRRRRLAQLPWVTTYTYTTGPTYTYTYPAAGGAAYVAAAAAGVGTAGAGAGAAPLVWGGAGAALGAGSSVYTPLDPAALAAAQAAQAKPAAGRASGQRTAAPAGGGPALAPAPAAAPVPARRAGRGATRRAARGGADGAAVAVAAAAPAAEPAPAPAAAPPAAPEAGPAAAAAPSSAAAAGGFCIPISRGRPFNVLAAGDSITQGSVPSKMTNHPYAWKVEELLKANLATSRVSVVDAGLGGGGIFQTGFTIPKTFGPYFQEQLASRAWGAVVVSIGINDLLRGGSPAADIMAGLQPLLDDVLEKGIPVIAIPPFAAPGFVSQGDAKEAERRKLAGLLHAAAAARAALTSGQGPQIWVLDLQAGPMDFYAMSPDERARWLDDGLHMTEFAYDALGAYVYQELAKHLCKAREAAQMRRSKQKGAAQRKKQQQQQQQQQKHKQQQQQQQQQQQRKPK
ncbi:Sh3yl1 [Scenedesmus sp. PABB004]|nr:Sh3yl1 [Scenedesmus sp. PABB004]